MTTFCRLLEMPAAVDADGLAGDEVGLAEQQHRLCDFDLSAPVANRRGLGDFVHFLLAHVGRGHNRTGRDGVHEDVVAARLRAPATP